MSFFQANYTVSSTSINPGNDRTLWADSGTSIEQYP